VVTAAKKFGARGTGIDIDPQRIQEANENLLPTLARIPRHPLGGKRGR